LPASINVIRERTRLTFRVTGAIFRAVNDPGVAAVVLHASTDGQADVMGSGLEAFRFGEFANFGLHAAAAGKKLLIILDASFSTEFARRFWDSVRRDLPRSAVESLEASVGFLTSAKQYLATTVPFVSTNPDLVNLFARTPTPDGLALGFLIDSSTFARRLNWLLAYGLAADGQRTVKNIPGLMNGADPSALGFEAEFVGSPSFSSLPFEFFFPFKSLTPGLALTASLNLTVDDVIPYQDPEPLDDVGRFWAVPGDEQTFDAHLVEIAFGEGGTLRKERDFLLWELGANHPIFRVLGMMRGPPGGNRGVEVEPLVPVGLIYHEISRVAHEREARPHLVHAVAGDAEWMADILAPMGVSVPTHAWHFLARLAEYRQAFESYEGFVDQIRTLVHELATRPVPRDEAVEDR
jgi:hypothetical protein